MIHLQDVSISYGKENALAGISLSIEKNTTCAIIGPSGCGKTTLIYAMAGLVRPDSGSVSIDGQLQTGIRQNTGVILQHYGLMPWKTAWKNVALGLQVRGVRKQDISHKVEAILKRLGIEQYAAKYPIQLSGGQKQRVAIGRTLALEPDVLLMDEPSSALDAITKEQLQNLILDIYKRNPVTMVLVTHNIEEAVFLGQRIVIMKKGGIKKILENPYFGDEALREKLDFYKICLEVRRWMDCDE
ncbi:MAG: ABC transporter ATP-binding protein [Bacillota bacterium]